MLYTRRILADKVAKATGVTKIEMRGLVPIVFEIIKAALNEGNTVSLLEFGTFYIKKVAFKVTKVRKNEWKKGKYIDVPLIKFKPSPSFRKLIRMKKGRSSDRTKYYTKKNKGDN